MITREQVRSALATSDTMVIQSLCRLSNKQTEIEKSAKVSIDRNFRGFRKNHGCLVAYAERVWSGDTLSQEEIDFLRYRMRIYAGQLAKMANNRQLALFTK